jgi:mRNA interferase YafQ
MYELKPTSRFKRDLKYIGRRGYDMRLLTTLIQTLAFYWVRKNHKAIFPL